MLQQSVLWAKQAAAATALELQTGSWFPVTAAALIRGLGELLSDQSGVGWGGQGSLIDVIQSHGRRRVNISPLKPPELKAPAWRSAAFVGLCCQGRGMCVSRLGRR